MIAFKTFLQLDENQRPAGIPLQWPWQEMDIADEDSLQFEQLGYVVMSVEQYASYKAQHQSAFDAWYSNQQGQILYFKIYDFVEDKKKFNTSTVPLTLDFRTGLTKVLHRKSTLVKGECVKEEYFENCSVDAAGNLTFTNLICAEHHAFIRDTLGFPIMRNSHIHFYDQNGIESAETKSWTKYYSQLEKIQEGKIRRGNLVDNLQMPVIGLIAIAVTGSPIPAPPIILTGRNFLFDYKKEFDAFVDESNKEILQCLTNPANAKYMSVSKYPWINSMTPYGVTIRQFLIAELTI